MLLHTVFFPPPKLCIIYFPFENIFELCTNASVPYAQGYGGKKNAFIAAQGVYSPTHHHPHLN